MAGKNNFAALRRYANKVHKFTQGKSLAELDPAKAAHGDSITGVELTEAEFEGVKGGICAALAADWLQEKLTRESGAYKAGTGTGKQLHAGLNLVTVKHAVPKFLDYRQKNPSDTKILELYGLSASKKAAFLNPMVTQKRNVVETSRSNNGTIYKKNLTVFDTLFKESLINGCRLDYLPEGRGAYITFHVDINPKDKPGRSGGHAVAAYYSRGEHLYFFDCNCGVYQVADPDGFFDAYVTCYKDLDCTLSFGNDKGFTYVDR